jgi:hypothetical protein
MGTLSEPQFCLQKAAAEAGITAMADDIHADLDGFFFEPLHSLDRYVHCWREAAARVRSWATARPSCDRDIGYLNTRQLTRTMAAPHPALMESAIGEFERAIIVAR